MNVNIIVLRDYTKVKYNWSFSEIKNEVVKLLGIS